MNKLLHILDLTAQLLPGISLILLGLVLIIAALTGVLFVWI